MQPEPGRQSASRTAVISLATAAIAAAVGFAAIYVTFGRPDNGPERSVTKVTTTPPTKPAPGAEAKEAPKGAVNPLSTGEMAAFVFHSAPRALPDIKIKDAEGKERSLAAWRGKVVLLNLWATWCLPCRKEMPALDRLQKALGSGEFAGKFEVVALSVDRKGLEASKKFLDETKVEKLALYVDPTARANTELRAPGLPVTLLIDAEGREIGRLLGPAEWDSEDALRLIRAALK